MNIKYCFLSFFLLFAVVLTSGGSIRLADKEPVNLEQSQISDVNPIAPENEPDVALLNGLPHSSLCNTEDVQPGTNIAVKRGQGEKYLLLLHAYKISAIVKASSGDHIKFADSLTHIFLFLFPYHFFW